MFAGKTLHCDCGYEVREDDEARCVEAVQRHASDAHGIDLGVELALEIVRRAGIVSSGGGKHGEERKKQ